MAALFLYFVRETGAAERRFYPVCAIALALCGFFTGSAAAQKPLFVARAEPAEIPEGRRFEVLFTLENAGGEIFQAPDFRPFRIVSGPEMLPDLGILRGKTYKTQSWRYILEAGKPGTFSIAAARVRAQGELLHTQPLQVRVTPARSGARNGAPPDRDDALFIQGEFQSQEAFVGQQMNYRIVLYTRLTVSNPELLSVPQTEKAYTHELRRFDARTRYERISGKEYAIRTLYEMAVFPTEAGRLEIGPVQMRVGVETPGAAGALFGPKPVILQTQAATISVNSLPAPVPPDFCGAVGQYNWKIQLDRAQITREDAVTLSVTLQGNGDSRRISAPVLQVPEGLEVFEPTVPSEEEFENGEALLHTRTYAYLLLPQREGTFDIQPKLQYFDPDSNRYVLKTWEKPIQITVTPSQSPSGARREDTAAEDGVSDPAGDCWKTFGIGLFLIVASGAGLWLFFRSRTRRLATAAAGNAALPRKSAQDEFADLRSLAQRGAAAEFYDRLYRFLPAQLGERFGLPPAQWSETALSAQMRVRGYGTTETEDVRHILQACEHALFAGQDRAADMQDIVRRAESVCAALSNRA
ncbi:MAG: BatD family protein [Saprospiraceae bacterium]